MRTHFAFAALLLACTFNASAVGPDNVARANRSLWPDEIQSPAGFDRASRAELLTFGHQLAISEDLAADALRERLHLKEVDVKHVDHMREIYWQRIARNYATASMHCVANEAFCPQATDVAAFKQASRKFDAPTDSRYAAWFQNAATFQRVYLDEILRLAALFPRISSEVDTFNANEFSGGDLPDKQFFLTFDDGPSAAGGTTEKMLDALRKAHLDGTFFVLGGNLQARAAKTTPIAIDHLYDGMCVAMHGWEHKSHSSMPLWQDSVTKTATLVRDTLPASYAPLFRPPYGQRKADSAAFFEAQHLKVALWNIDSQDWNGSVSADEAGQRVLTLMLLWRRGVILFHDIHNKAPTAVPYLVAQTQGDGVTWMPCKSLPGVTDSSVVPAQTVTP